MEGGAFSWSSVCLLCVWRRGTERRGRKGKGKVGKERRRSTFGLAQHIPIQIFVLGQERGQKKSSPTKLQTWKKMANTNRHRRSRKTKRGKGDR